MNHSIKKTIFDPEIYNQTRHRDQGYQRVAVLLLTLDLPEQVRILQQLSHAEKQGVLNLIAETGKLSARDVQRVREEFGLCGCTVPDMIEAGYCGGADIAAKLTTAVSGSSRDRI